MPTAQDSSLSTSRIIVCDNGTGFVKVGWATDNAPRHCFPSVLGRPKQSGISEHTRQMLLESHPSKGKDGRDKEAEGSQSSEMWLCGEQTEDKRSLLELTFPLARGVIQDWPAMDRLWQYTFGDKLGLADLRGYSVLLTEAPLNPVDNRRRMLQAMFERFGCDRVHVATQAVLTLYSQGLTTGLVVDSGDGVTHVVPVWDGFVLDHLTRRLDLAGRKVTEQLRNLLVTRRGLCLGKQPADLELMRALKERVCYVSPSYADDVRVEDETTFHLTEQLLSDGKTTVRLSGERFEAPEILFRPELVGVEQPGLSDLVFACIQQADVDLRSSLYQHIILSGGTSMMAGFAERLQADLERLYCQRINATKVIRPPERAHAVYTGGAVLAELMRDSEAFWVTRQEWHELGAQHCLDKLRRVKS